MVLPCIVFAQSTPRPDNIVLDSIKLDGYRAVRQELRKKDGEKATEELAIYKGNKKVMSSLGRHIELFNFGSTGPDSTGELYARDINGDGFAEAIITTFTESDFCCNYITIISLGENINEIGSFELKEIDIFYLEDIDGDSIPELFFRDPGFIGWRYSFQDSPRPLLIWKWHEGNYYLANHDYSEYLSAKIGADDFRELDSQIRKWQDRAEKSPSQDTTGLLIPPVKLIEVMLDYYYSGKTQTADSLLDADWPAEIPGKDAFRSELAQRLNECPYWKIMQKGPAETEEN